MMMQFRLCPLAAETAVRTEEKYLLKAKSNCKQLYLTIRKGFCKLKSIWQLFTAEVIAAAHRLNKVLSHSVQSVSRYFSMRSGAKWFISSGSTAIPLLLSIRLVSGRSYRFSS